MMRTFQHCNMRTSNHPPFPHINVKASCQYAFSVIENADPEADIATRGRSRITLPPARV